MEREITKKYTCEDLTIVWKPKLCVHAGICVKTLPEVYNPKARPWINTEKASVESLKEQISKCPTGALSYYMKGEDNKKAVSPEIKVEVLENGPLLVHGTLNVIDKEGNSEIKNKSTAFCRCGQTLNKPYCDGTHVRANFKD